MLTGTPEGVGELKVGDKLEAFIGRKSVLKCDILAQAPKKSRSRSRSTGAKKKAGKKKPAPKKVKKRPAKKAKKRPAKRAKSAGKSRRSRSKTRPKKK